MMMTGRSALYRFASRITVRPSMPGIFRSAIRRSYGYIRIRSSAERPSGATSTSYSASASVFASRSRMLASSSTTSTRGRAVLPEAGRAGVAAAGTGRAPPRSRWLSSQASMSRLRKRHWRPTRTAGIFPALINRYTVRRLTWRYSRTPSVVRKVSSIMRLHRQFDGKDGAAVGMVGGDNLPAMILDDPVCDRQAQPGAFADFFRRVERLKNVREHLGREAAARVADGR